MIREKRPISIIKRFIIRLVEQKVKIFVIIVATILSCLTYALMPLYSGKALDGLISVLKFEHTVDPHSLLIKAVIKPVTILLLLSIASTLLAFVQQRVIASVGENLTLSLRKDVNKKITRLPIAYFDSHSTGEIMSITTNDLEKVAEVMQTGFMQFIYSTFTIISTITIMLIVNIKLTILVVLSACISAVITSILSKKTQKVFYENQEIISELNSQIEEAYSGIYEIKIFNHQEQTISSVHELNNRQLRLGKKAEFFTYGIFPVIRFLNQMGFILTAIISGGMVLHGQITIGLAQAFLQYTNQLAEPITQTSQVINSFQAAFASGARIFQFLDEEEEVQTLPFPLSIQEEGGHVQFKNVQFGYEEKQPLMKNIDFEAKPFHTIAIVGPTGGGKTTLINLLMRFYDITDGEILLNGTNIQHMSRAQLRQHMSIVLQDIWLFEGSIAENISYGKPMATMDEIIAASKAARCHHFIKLLPDGYNTIISNETGLLSHGQLQLLTIARAMLRDSQIIILDEATSSVDTRTENEVQKAITTILKNRTSFIIAHRLSTIRNADLILVVKDGDIIEMGSHQYLIKRNGFYATLLKKI